MQDFRTLRVWRKAIGLALNVRNATNRFPPRGYAELKAQMRSSAESIVHNIVESCGGTTAAEQARFISIAIKSSCELEGQLEMAKLYEILGSNDWASLTEQCIDHPPHAAWLAKNDGANRPVGVHQYRRTRGTEQETLNALTGAMSPTSSDSAQLD